MNRLLLLTLCLATLLPATAMADPDGGWGRSRERGEWRHGRDREDRDSRDDRDEGGRHCHRMDRGRHRSKVDVILRGGFALNGEGHGPMQMMRDGQFGWHDLNGGVAAELGVRYWVTRYLGIGLAAGYADLGRNGDAVATPVPLGIPDTLGGYMNHGRSSRAWAIPITAQLTFRAPIRSFVKPYVEIGAGMYALHGPNPDLYYAAVQAPGPGPQNYGDPGYLNSTSWRFGGLGGAGVELRAGRLGFTLGGRWNVVSANHQSFDHATFLAGVVLR